MKCQNCGKNEANIKYVQTINGEKDEMFLCEKCAKDMNIDMNFDMHFGFDNIFSSLFGGETFVKPMELSDELACDVCGLKYDEFATSGLVGCENCYKVFSKRLENVIKRLHGNNRHVEVSPKKQPNFIRQSADKNDLKEEIKALRIELEECIKKEEYEQAAILRDKIKVLEKKVIDKERGE